MIMRDCRGAIIATSLLFPPAAAEPMHIHTPCLSRLYASRVSFVPGARFFSRFFFSPSRTPRCVNGTRLCVSERRRGVEDEEKTVRRRTRPEEPPSRLRRFRACTCVYTSRRTFYYPYRGLAGRDRRSSSIRLDPSLSLSLSGRYASAFGCSAPSTSLETPTWD